MKPAASHPLRSRSFVILIHAGLWLLLYLALLGLRGGSPGFRETYSSTASPRSLLPAARLERLFAANSWPRIPAATNSLNPFFTEYFNPVKPPSTPPTTRDIELTYLGFYQTGDGPKKAMVKLGDAIIVAQVGSNLTANLFAAHASILSLTLTNPAAQTNLLPLNAKTQMKVPIQ
jgi:hypothetical protein